MSVPTPAVSMHQNTLKTFLAPTDQISCGGGFFPPAHNMANVSTFNNQSFVLPTKEYSVLVLKSDGNAIIYTDDMPPEEDDNQPLPELPKKDDDPDDEDS